MRSYKSWCKPVSWLITLRLMTKNLKMRDKLIYFLQSKGIDARPMIRPVHKAKHLRYIFKKKKYRNSIHQSMTSFHLPSSPNLSSKKIEYICNQLKLFLKYNKKKI